MSKIPIEDYNQEVLKLVQAIDGVTEVHLAPLRKGKVGFEFVQRIDITRDALLTCLVDAFLTPHFMPNNNTSFRGDIARKLADDINKSFLNARSLIFMANKGEE
jgi:hypothetical protein